MMPRHHAGLAAALALCLAGCATFGRGGGPAPDPASGLAAEYARLLRSHRPDLAERWLAPSRESVGFEPISGASVAAHERTLRGLLERANALPASTPADSLRARLAHELSETVPGGALHHDPMLWLELVAAAARAPWAGDSSGGCREADQAARRLERVPDALRGAAVLMRAAPRPDRAEFEDAVSHTEWVFRHDLPARTGTCRDSRAMAAFVVADSLAAGALADFRRSLWDEH